MLIDSYSQIREFYGRTAVESVNEANKWLEESKVIATGLICFNTLPNGPDNSSDYRWCVLITCNIKEPLNATEEAARERMPKDIPYMPKGRIEGTRHH